MQSSWLDEFRGQHITLLSNVGSEERTDTGTLVRIADGWLQVAKDNGEMILVPGTAIRQIKLLNLNHTVPSADRDILAPMDNHIYEPHVHR